MAQHAAPFRLQPDRRHDRAGARRAAAVAEIRGPRHRRHRGGPPRARHHAGRLRAAGAAPRASTIPPFACSPGAASTSSSRPAPAAAARSPIISATRREQSHFAKRNVDAWSKELAKGPVDAIIVNASGCGTMVKDYGHLLKREPDYAARAARISDLAHDISEFVGEYELGAAQALVVAARRLSPGLLAAARPGHQGRAARVARQGGLQRSSTFRNRTSAAARPEPTTSCSRRSPARCASARRRTSSA